MLSRSNAALIALAFFVAGCPTGPRKAVWAEHGSTTSHLSFGFGHVRGTVEPILVAGLSVVPCGSAHEVWHIDASVADSRLSRVLYGQTPNGFKETVPPGRLAAGCYNVTMGEGGSAFEVMADGSITPKEN
jgi:hypothetical protein